MDVQFAPQVESQLNDLATQSGRGPAELVQDAVAGYLSDLRETREMLDSRYDDIKSGRVKLLDGEEAFARLRERIQARRNARA